MEVTRNSVLEKNDCEELFDVIQKKKYKQKIYIKNTNNLDKTEIDRPLERPGIQILEFPFHLF